MPRLLARLLNGGYSLKPLTHTSHAGLEEVALILVILKQLVVLQAIEAGMAAVRQICSGLRDWAAKAGKPKQEPPPEAELAQLPDQDTEMMGQLREIYQRGLSALLPMQCSLVCDAMRLSAAVHRCIEGCSARRPGHSAQGICRGF